jgi:RNA polymerase sigma factor (sigma-70 family)
MEVSSLPRPSGGIQPRSPRLLAAFGDDRLVEQVRRGNDAAFEVVYDRYHRGILSFCRHMLRSREEAEDAVQQTFISAHGGLRGSDTAIRLKPWLYTIARNRCLSILRARRERPAEIEDVPVAGFSDEVARRDDLRRLLADMRDLPEKQRAALVLSELGDLSHAEIARVLDCAPMKVKSLVFQARSSLIESRDAREIPCETIREQLATLTGGALRRGPLRRHVKACPGCAQFRDDVRRQRQLVACLLPVVPSVGLKSGVLAAVGIGPGAAAGAAAAAGAGTGGGILSGIGASGTAKLGVAALLASGAVGGGIAVQRVTDSSADNPPHAAKVAPTRGDSTYGQLRAGSAGSANSTAAAAAQGVAHARSADGRHHPGAAGHHPAAHGRGHGAQRRRHAARHGQVGGGAGTTVRTHGHGRRNGTHKHASPPRRHQPAPAQGTGSGSPSAGKGTKAGAGRLSHVPGNGHRAGNSAGDPVHGHNRLPLPPA